MSSLPEGSQIGPYRVLRKIRAGGMGAVYEALHQTIERRVAIKVLHLQYSEDPELLARFLNEARAVNHIIHPGIVQISDHGQLSEGRSYIVMEYLPGVTLRERIIGGRLTLAQILQIGHLLADALAAAHQAGVLHRDLKPDNVMLVADAGVPGGERTKLLDFGIAKLAVPGQDLRTKTHALMGTPAYMSPEQCRGAGEVDERSDVYSLGVMLYEMLSGAPPFSAAGAGELLMKHMNQAPLPLAQVAPQVPPRVAELVERLLAKQPAQRPNMPELAQMLAALQGPPGVVGTGADLQAGVSATMPGITLHPSTLGTAVGQAKAAGGHARETILGIGGLLVVALAGGGIWFVKGQVPRVPLVAPMAAVPQAAPQPPPKIHWSIQTVPAGAQVVRLADGAVLGTTPFSLERRAGSGTVEVELRHDGFASVRVTLDREVSTRIGQSLTPLPADSPERPALSEPKGKPNAVRHATPKKPLREMQDDEVEIVK